MGFTSQPEHVPSAFSMGSDDQHGLARHLTAPEVDGIAASVLIAGDDPEAKQIVFALAGDMGFHPVDIGPLKATRELERLVGVMLFVRLGPLRVLSRS